MDRPCHPAEGARAAWGLGQHHYREGARGNSGEAWRSGEVAKWRSGEVDRSEDRATPPAGRGGTRVRRGSAYLRCAGMRGLTPRPSPARYAAEAVRAIRCGPTCLLNRPAAQISRRRNQSGRLTTEQFEIAFNSGAIPPTPSLPLVMLGRRWLPRRLARRRLEAHGYRWVPHFESSSEKFTPAPIQLAGSQIRKPPDPCSSLASPCQFSACLKQGSSPQRSQKL